MGLVARAIDDQLLAEIARLHRRAGLLDFHDDPLGLQEEIDPRCAAGVAARPFFWTNIFEVQSQDGVEEILDVVFVVDGDRRPISVTVLELARGRMELQANLLKEV
jgi:hypothetical protein